MVYVRARGKAWRGGGWILEDGRRVCVCVCVSHLWLFYYCARSGLCVRKHTEERRNAEEEEGARCVLCACGVCEEEKMCVCVCECC